MYFKELISKMDYVFAAIGLMLGRFLGGMDGLLYALIAFVVVDYITGVLVAIYQKQLSSARRNQDATIRKTKESQSIHARFTAEARNLVTDSGQLSERKRDLESEKA